MSSFAFVRADMVVDKTHMRESLTTRLVLVMGGCVIGTALILSALATFLLGTALDQSVQARLDASRNTATAIVDLRLAGLSDLARVIGNDPRLLQAMRQRDAAALDGIVQRYGAALPSAWLVVVTASGQRASANLTARMDAEQTTMADALQGSASRGLVRLGESGLIDHCQLNALFSLPIRADDAIVGALVVGSPLGAEFVEQLKLKTQTPSQAWLWCGTSVDATVIGPASLVVDARLSEKALRDGQLAVGASRVDGVAQYGHYVPLFDLRGQVIGMYGFSQPTQTIDAVRDDTTRLFLALAVLFAAVMLGAAFLLAQGMTRPLTMLTRATQAMAAGDLSTPVRINDQDEIGVLARSIDTMRERLAQTLDALARERNRYREFLALMPHEFKTPLSALAASVELLDSDDEYLSTDQRLLLGSIHRSVLRLHQLVDNLLDTASIQAGHFHVRVQPHSLAPIIVEACSFAQPLLDQKQQPLSVQLAESLPNVMADPQRITQVLINLLSNAHKYGPPGEPVTLTAAPDVAGVRLAVSDRGPGISLREQRDLFRRFMRTYTDGANAPAGVGLGLAIMKEIITQHHGEVGLDSRPEQGTTVWFTLPLAAPPTDDSDE